MSITAKTDLQLFEMLWKAPKDATLGQLLERKLAGDELVARHGATMALSMFGGWCMAVQKDPELVPKK